MKVAKFALPLRISSALKDGGVTLRALYFLLYGSSGACFPFFNVYLRQIGLSGLQIGAIASIRPAATLISQPLWGMGADLWGRRRTLLVTMLLAAGLLIGFTWSKSFWFLFGWAILYSLLTNPVGSLIDSLVLDHLETRRSLSYGQFRLWGAVGWAALAFAAGRAIAGRDMRLIFAFGALLMLLGWVLALLTTREADGRVSLGHHWRGLAPLLHNRKLLIFLALIVLTQTGTISISTFYSVYLNQIGASSQLIGFAYSLQGLSELPLYLSAAAIIRRLGPTKTLAVAFLVYASRAFFYSFVSSPVLAVTMEVTRGLSFSLFLVASVDYVNRQVPAEWRATGQSLFGAAYMGAGGILGNTWAGFLYDRLGVQGMFRVNGLIIVAVALVVVVALRGRGSYPDGMQEV